jgi:hypothetical protein
MTLGTHFHRILDRVPPMWKQPMVVADAHLYRLRDWLDWMMPEAWKR